MRLARQQEQRLNSRDVKNYLCRVYPKPLTVRKENPDHFLFSMLRRMEQRKEVSLEDKGDRTIVKLAGYDYPEGDR